MSIRNKLYRLCNEKEYFTCGALEQYEKMFSLAENGASAHDIALVIWLCSDDKDLSVIEEEVSALQN